MARYSNNIKFNKISNGKAGLKQINTYGLLLKMPPEFNRDTLYSINSHTEMGVVDFEIYLLTPHKEPELIYTFKDIYNNHWYLTDSTIDLTAIEYTFEPESLYNFSILGKVWSLDKGYKIDLILSTMTAHIRDLQSRYPRLYKIDSIVQIDSELGIIHESIKSRSKYELEKNSDAYQVTSTGEELRFYITFRDAKRSVTPSIVAPNEIVSLIPGGFCIKDGQETEYYWPIELHSSFYVFNNKSNQDYSMQAVLNYNDTDYIFNHSFTFEYTQHPEYSYLYIQKDTMHFKAYVLITKEIELYSETIDTYTPNKRIANFYVKANNRFQVHGQLEYDFTSNQSYASELSISKNGIYPYWVTDDYQVKYLINEFLATIFNGYFEDKSDDISENIIDATHRYYSYNDNNSLSNNTHKVLTSWRYDPSDKLINLKPGSYILNAKNSSLHYHSINLIENKLNINYKEYPIDNFEWLKDYYEKSKFDETVNGWFLDLYAYEKYNSTIPLVLNWFNELDDKYCVLLDIDTNYKQ